MKEILPDTGLIAKCGLFCGACKRYLEDKCHGCMENERAGWCKVRACCIDNDYASCADCSEFEVADDCKKFNNFFSKAFGFIFKSDRQACIVMIKEKGYRDYAEYMAENGLQSIKRN